MEQLEIRTGDEIETLAGAMKKMERDINDYILNLAQITAEKERIGRSCPSPRKSRPACCPGSSRPSRSGGI